MPTEKLAERTCRKCKETFVPSIAFAFYPDGRNPEVGLCESCFVEEALVSKVTPLSEEHVKEICKMGRGPKTCAFLIMSGKGFECGKGSGVEPCIRMRIAEGIMTAKGNNCSGPPNFALLS